MKKEVKTQLEESGFDVENTLNRFMGNEEQYIRILKKFQNDLNYQNLVLAIAEQRYEDGFLYSHTLKGVTGNLGMNNLLEANHVVLEKLRKKQTEGLEKDMEKVTNRYEQALQAIEKL
ncbi:MAG: Hpt domain-containing protein [Lachnospiraceae bacterium]